jgi:tetratricopeptide (TPR) repeat protein
VQTRFATWLDADDEWLAGRGTRVLERLSRGDCDVAADATILADEAGTERLVSLPPWASGSAMPARLFERNPLPAIGLIAFHVGTWRDLGYDAGFHGAEDVDIVLRAIAQGVRFGWIAKPGTRVHVRSDSLSRRRDNQRSMYVRALRKHPYPVVRSIYNEAGCDGSTTAEGLASMALFRGDGDAALQFIEEAAAHTVNGWRLAFGRGVAHLLRGDALRAVESLDLAETFSASPEGANNLGVAHATMGDVGAARRWFEAALERFPSYQDARLNLTAATGWRVTTHPLRNRE